MWEPTQADIDQMATLGVHMWSAAVCFVVASLVALVGGR